MIDRRNFLALTLSGMTSAAALGVAPALHASAGNDDAKLHDILERMYRGWLDRSPEGLTELGLDAGARADARSRLDDRSRAADDAFVAMQREFLRELDAIEEARLGPDAAIYRDIVREHLRPAIAGALRHPYGVRGDSVPFMLNQFSGVQPYVLSHLNGVYFWMPNFLVNKHPLSTTSDAEAYVRRLEALGVALDQETERAREDVEDHGIVPPDFILEQAQRQMEQACNAPASETVLVRNLAGRAPASSASDALLRRAASALDRIVKPAVERQIALVESLKARSASDPGVWRLQDGAAYYSWALKVNTSTDVPAAELHRLGLHHVAEISVRADALLKRQGYSQGTVGARLAALAAEERFRFPDNEQGKAAILDLFRSLTDGMAKRLPSWFGVLPDAALRVEAVPAAMEASAPRGYYQRGTLDGSRPGIYFANLRSSKEWSRFYLPTFAYHEGVPGHHLQLAIALQSTGSSKVLKLLQMAGFSEGWALYAEQLADEMGVYDDDPFGQIGYLQSSLFRAVRLVVDTGLHHGRWGRDRAVRYMRETLGQTASRCRSEVDRYVAWPGQACSYKLGHLRWAELRRRAQSALGDRFDIRAFHDAALRHGAMSFSLLERTIDRWTGRRS